MAVVTSACEKIYARVQLLGTFLAAVLTRGLDARAAWEMVGGMINVGMQTAAFWQL